MSGISSSGLISGIDTNQLIEQLLAVSARPQQLAQQRLIELQTEQAAFLDLNSRMNTLQSSAQSFRIDSVFDSKRASSTDTDTLRASASLSARPGTYTMLVDRLVTSQQMLSKGFADTDTQPLGLSKLTFEPPEARLDRDVSLADLNGGAGVDRGRILVENSSGSTAEVDLSKAANISEVIEAINSAGLGVTAYAVDGALHIDGAVAVTSQGDATTAEDLGLAGASLNGTVLEGTSVYQLTADTLVSTLNDGYGVDRDIGADGEQRTDFTLVFDVDPTAGEDLISVSVNVGSVFEFQTDDDGNDVLAEVSGPASTVGDVIDRINAAIADNARAAELGSTAASVDTANGAIAFTLGTDVALKEVNEFQDGRAASDLGLASISDATGTATGGRILGGLTTTLLKNINGGGGVGGDGVLDFELANGDTFSIALDLNAVSTVQGVIDAINSDATNAGRVTASLNEAGTGLMLTDTTYNGTTATAAFVVTGTGGSDTAESLGVSTGAGGVSGGALTGSSAQLRYVSESTLLDSLNGGEGVGTGTIRIADSQGGIRDVVISSSQTTVRDLLDQLNTVSGITARINANGDGIEIVEDSGIDGALPISVSDVSGSVARKLGIRGEASGTGADNVIDGSFETTIEFDPATDTLDDVVGLINSSSAPVTATILNDGTGSRPYHLSLVSEATGRAGRFTFDTHGVDLGMQTLDKGEDSKVFFGSSDPANGVLLTSSSDRLDNAITGVTIDLIGASADPVELTVTSDTTAIEDQVNDFVGAFNSVLDAIDNQTRFVEETGERGALLGDTTAQGLENSLITTVLGGNAGFSDTFDVLSDVGVRLGTGSRLEFDREAFRQALEEDPEAVEALFATRTIDPGQDDDPSRPGVQQQIGENAFVTITNDEDEFSALGVIPQIEQLAQAYVDSIDGVFKRRDDTINTQIESQEDRIEQLQEQLDRERATLEAEFVAMEQALASLQTQQNALASLIA